MPNEIIVRPLILVADPDVEAAVAITRQLEWAGYEVLTTGRADETLEVIEEKRPDAVVLEAMIPETSGYDVVRELRDQPHHRLLPIVMITARAGKLDRDFAFTVGVNEYLKKPFRSADLVARLALLAPARPFEVVPSATRGTRRIQPVVRRTPAAAPALALR